MAGIKLSQEALIGLMHKGDPRCPINMGDRFYKVAGEEGDRHSIGSEGIVTGSAYLKEEQVSCYLVKFDGDQDEVFISGPKISKL